MGSTVGLFYILSVAAKVCIFAFFSCSCSMIKKNHSFHYYYTVKRFNPEVMARLSALKVVIKYSIKPVCHITLQQYAE